MPRWVKVLLLALAVVALAVLLAPVSGVVQVVVLGALLAYLLDPLAVQLETRGLSRGWASAAVFLGLFVTIGVPLALLFPTLAAQVVSLQEGIDLEAVSELMEDVE